MDRLFCELEKERKVLVFGHRGLSEYYPENTMLSFSKCAENPLNDGIELDVHVCKSGEVVVAHDFSLKRTAGIDREIETFTYEELKTIDVGSFKGDGFCDCRVPLLKDLFHTFGSRFYYDVELKVKAGQVNRELSEKVYDIIKDFGLQDKVMVSSFNPVALKVFKKVSGAEMETADIFTVSENIPRVLQKGAGHLVSGATYQKPGVEIIDDAYMKRHGKLPIITWTVNQKNDVKRLLQYNENGPMKVFGMIGNDPNMISEILNH